jgi:hypothetical protein
METMLPGQVERHKAGLLLLPLQVERDKHSFFVRAVEGESSCGRAHEGAALNAQLCMPLRQA